MFVVIFKLWRAEKMLGFDVQIDIFPLNYGGVDWRPISSSALHVAVRSTRRSLNLLAGIPAVIVVEYQRKVFYSTVTTVVLLQLLAVVHLVIIITSGPLLNACVLNHVGAAKGQNRFVVAGVDWVSVCVWGKPVRYDLHWPPSLQFAASLRLWRSAARLWGWRLGPPRTPLPPWCTSSHFLSDRRRSSTRCSRPAPTGPAGRSPRRPGERSAIIINKASRMIDEHWKKKKRRARLFRKRFYLLL